MNNRFLKAGLSFMLATPAVAAIATTCIAISEVRMYSELKNVYPYLWSITYKNGYLEDTEWETTKEAEAFGCSSVRKGNFYGRNFDYVFNDTPEFIVRVNACPEKGIKYSSIGVATHFGLRENKLSAGLYGRSLDLIPNLTLDGINSEGLICSHNVVDKEDMGDIGQGTNPSADKDLHMLFIPRYVLDHAATVEEAINLIENVNVVGNLNNKEYLHIMIADKNKTAIVEFIPHEKDGKFNVVAKYVENDQQIMTNHYLNMEEAQTTCVNEHKHGNERYAILQHYYSEAVESVDGLQKLMQRVKFSISYQYEHDAKGYPYGDPDITHDPEWYSEGVTQSELSAITTEAGWLELQNKLVPLKDEYKIAIENDDRAKADPRFWHTTHNSTYDMEARKLYIYCQEQYDRQVIEVSLNQE